MRIVLVVFGFMVLIGTHLTAQESDPWADAVVLFQPGEGQNLGQSPEYFPDNVLGPPDTNATFTVASADPREILSLGLGGVIVLAFTDNLIIDGPGPDFTVFENAFIRQFGPKAGLPFAEPAVVAVSKDGKTFVPFPYDSLSLEGLAGVTPTNGRADPTNPDSSGGDAFDLSEVGLDTIRFIRLTDVTAMIKDNPDHPFWDPTLSGFDLDAVVAVHSIPAVPTGVASAAGRMLPKAFALYPNPWQPAKHRRMVIRGPLSGRVQVRLYDSLGRTVQVFTRPAAPPTDAWQVPLKTDLPPGVYFLSVVLPGNFRHTLKFSVIR